MWGFTGIFLKLRDLLHSNYMFLLIELHIYSLYLIETYNRSFYVVFPKTNSKQQNHPIGRREI